MWNDAKKCKPKQGDRVLLAIKYESCPVVGYWGSGLFEVCTMNMEVACGAYCQGGSPEKAFEDEDVTHWMGLPDVPNIKE